MKFIDDKNKKLTWWTRNYCYLGTILFVCICILIHAFFGDATPDVAAKEHTWDSLSFSNLFQAFLNNVFHSNWQHVLLNMLAFSVCGFYIERKTGTFNFLLLTFAVIIFDAAFTAGNNMSLAWIGASGIQYLYYGYIIIDYIFSFQKAKRNKTNTILGGIILGVIYISMCFNGGTSSFSFVVYPNDLITNLGHYTPFFAGLIVGLVIQISQLKVIKAATLNYENNIEEKQKKAYNIVNICAVAVSICLILFTSIAGGIANSRKNLTVNFYCNYEEYNVSYNKVLNNTNYKLYFRAYYYDWYNNIDYNLRQNLVCEIYTNENKTKHMDNFNNNYYSNYLTLSDEFIALSKPTEFNYYIEIYNSFKISNDKGNYISEIIEENTTTCENTTLYNLDNSNTNKIKEGDTYKFKVKLWDSNYIKGIKVFNNGQELLIDENGYYVVENVMEDISITYEYLTI